MAVTGLAGCALDNEETPNGHLLVENPANDAVRLSLVVTANPGGDGERIIDGVYGVPAGHVLQFEGVLESGSQYSIDAAVLPNQQEGRVEVGVETCDEGDSAEKMDVRVRATSDSLGIIPYGCDQTYTRSEDMTYVDPSDYQVEEGTT